ncbi:MAG: hypothetical protein FD180_4718 [Planctomycetota bacterium]|nr:MAG: hypothetical protein FD180_4718 [Planctomycetota bacterium]
MREFCDAEPGTTVPKPAREATAPTDQATRSRFAAARDWAGRKRPQCPASLMCILAAAFVVLFNNSRLFSLLAGRSDLASMAGIACCAAVFIGVTGMVAVVLFFLGQPYVLKPVLIALLTLSAILGYFTNEWGIVFDLKMIRNIAETIADRNRLEAAELVSATLALRLFLLALLPSLAVLATKVTWKRPRRELLERALYAGGMAVALALLVLPNYRYMLFFGRENVRLKYYATPTYAVDSLRKYVLASLARNKPFETLGQDAVRAGNSRRRTVGIMVVGETARADHFSLNGYARKTNPLLERRPLLNYAQTTASGTSTSYSVPCMFSFLTKKRFTTEKAAGQSNVLDVLEHAGIKVVWIDNNSSDKGVCKRLGCVNLRHDPDPASPWYVDGGYYDEVLLENLGAHLEGTESDVLIVLHTMGSHGPAYHRRYPPAFGKFEPFCRCDAPQQASVEEVVNAYDNTILYTDYVLDRLIGYLESLDDDNRTFLYYVSDHGESLGENGVYLHGLPDVLAPEAQTHVPMLMWLSDGYAADRALDLALLKSCCDLPTSHDNVPHTLLGLFEVRTSVYREELDLLRAK